VEARSEVVLYRVAADRSA